MRHVALEVPLGLLALRGDAEGDDARDAGVERGGDRLDRAALARGVAALEHDDVPQAVGLAPVLQLQQLDLQDVLLFLVIGPRHPLVVGIVLPPGVDRDALGIEQNRIVVFVVDNGVTIEVYLHRRNLAQRGNGGVTAR